MEQDGSRLSRLNLGRGGGGAVVSEGNLKKGGDGRSRTEIGGDREGIVERETVRSVPR